MSHSVSSKARADREGGFSFECIGYDGKVFRAAGGFATQPEAIAAAERAERDMMAGFIALSPEAQALHDSISDDELLRELMG